MPKKILFVFGTRPEAIKLCPLINLLKGDKYFQVKVCLTSQHREMLTQVMDFFKVRDDFNLKIMKTKQDLYDITTNTLLGMKKVLKRFRPGAVIVQGDTTSAFAAALSSFYEKISIIHVEAGLRTKNKYLPFPEEANRHLISCLADIHLAPTITARQNLISEGVNRERIFVTGNTCVDALFFVLKKIRDATPAPFKEINFDCRKTILITGHRRENFGKPFENICLALKEIALKYPMVNIVYPVHLNPNVRKPVNNILRKIANVYLLEPLSYPDFVWLINKSYFIVTDSGGIQEEAPSLGKPVLVMRDVTERPEGVNAGVVKIIGTNKESIIRNIERLLCSRKMYSAMSKRGDIYGDGTAIVKIKEILKKFLKNIER